MTMIADLGAGTTIIPVAREHAVLLAANSDGYVFEVERGVFAIEYNMDEGSYEGEILLKNGFYDYYYATTNSETGNLDIIELEGSTFEAENDYLIFVYYRKYGSRYDQLVAFNKTSSNKR